MDIPKQAADQTTPTLLKFTSIEGEKKLSLPAISVSQTDKTIENKKEQPSQIVKEGEKIRKETRNFIKQEDSQSNENQELKGASACDHPQKQITELSDENKRQTKKVIRREPSYKEIAETVTTQINALHKLTTKKREKYGVEDIHKIHNDSRTTIRSATITNISQNKITAALDELKVKIIESIAKNTPCDDSKNRAILAVQKELQLYSDSVTESCEKFLHATKELNTEKHKSPLTEHKQPDHQKDDLDALIERKNNLRHVTELKLNHLTTYKTKRDVLKQLDEFDKQTDKDKKNKGKIKKNAEEDTMKTINKLLAGDTRMEQDNNSPTTKEQSVWRLFPKNGTTPLTKTDGTQGASDEKKIEKETNNIIKEVKENILESSKRLLNNKKEEHINGLIESSKTATAAGAQTDETDRKPESTSTEKTTDNIKKDARALSILTGALFKIIETRKNEIEGIKLQKVDLPEDYANFEANEIINSGIRELREVLF